MNGVYRACDVFGAGMRNGGVVSVKGTLYGIAKATILFMTKVMAVEWAPTVRVNAIAPTAIPSGMTSDLDLFSNPDYVTNKIADIPLRRYGTPDEFGRVAAFVLSPAASYITGAIIPIDGGALRGI